MTEEAVSGDRASLIQKVEAARTDYYWGYMGFTDEDADQIIKALRSVPSEGTGQ